jgi:Cupin
MDALSDILRVARLSGGVFFNAEFSAPWCIAAQMAPELCAPFLGATNHLIPYHYVVDGEMQVALPDQPAQPLRSGEVVLFPRNDFHLIGSDVSLPPVSAAAVILDGGNRIVQTVRHGGGGEAAHMVCGFLGCDRGLTAPIVSTLPQSMILRVDETPAADWIRSTLQYAANEVAGGQTGSTAVLSKRIARSRRFPGIGTHARRHRPCLERRGARARSRTIPLGPRRKVHPGDRRGADALPRRLAPAGRRAKVEGLQRSAGSGRRTGRI